MNDKDLGERWKSMAVGSFGGGFLLGILSENSKIAGGYFFCLLVVFSVVGAALWTSLACSKWDFENNVTTALAIGYFWTVPFGFVGVLLSR